MNNWHKIWNKKTCEVNIDEDVFSVFRSLKIANGFDVMTEDGYYEAFFQDFKDMTDKIHASVGTFESVYEVGCGSGVNLYLFNKLENITKLGGCDYSESLITLAKDVVGVQDIRILDAEEIDTEEKFDIVLADSVFQYFTSPEKGYKVLDLMRRKANKMVILTEVHDQALEQEHLDYRRSQIEDYDERYKGLDKTFYSREKLLEYVASLGPEYACEIIKPNNEKYWNNRFVFDFYLWKK
ncbi:MAG: class I SAM-dependent methyltransferase [Clostridiales bacterium]|nr:class I SAM-dependent methyltransferase [Clostridiales bacterium]